MQNSDATLTPMKEFLMNNDIVHVNKRIGFNVNEYPFATFIDSDNNAVNIYFSKKLSSIIEENSFDDFAEVVEYIGGITDYITDEGEPRQKISASGESTRYDVLGMF